MKNNADKIYKKIQQLNQDVKKNLRSRGVVVPSRHKDGSIQVGRYKIKREDSGFYSILDNRNEFVVAQINLPQTAAIIANSLALGKFLDEEILKADRSYGHALFEEVLQKKIAETSLRSKNLDRAEVMYTKSSVSKYRKERCKKAIVIGFDKLMRFG
jgi:hypothetical protein